MGCGYHVRVASAGQLQPVGGESYALHPRGVPFELEKQASGQGLPDVDGLVPGARCLNSRQLVIQGFGACMLAGPQNGS